MRIDTVYVQVLQSFQGIQTLSGYRVGTENPLFKSYTSVCTEWMNCILNVY